MFPLRSEPRPNRKWGQARDGDYSCRVSPLRDPMPSEPSRTDGTDEGWTDEEEVSASAGVAEDSATAGWSSVPGDSSTFSRNVADGTKNKLPVTARLKSRMRS